MVKIWAWDLQKNRPAEQGERKLDIFVLQK